MDRQVLERLIGAVVIVAAAVIVIPEFLSGPREPTVEKTLELPTADEVSANQTHTIRLAEPEPVPEPVSSPPIPEPAPAARPVEESVDVAAPVAPSVVEQPEVIAEAPATTVGVGWAVQVGSFSRLDNAERLAAALKEQGYPAFVSRLATGSSIMHRVRVGPEQDRARAEALAERLRKDGQTAQVVGHP